ncbi:MAG TPA: hypothetical protein VGO55_10455 [Allosphingosinicella sp.]|jgi:hypothetical protein|nr:hypothetical protein [Allosphingosinicella sp.]
MSARPGAGDALKRTLRAYFVKLGAAVAIESLASRPWASITLSGERHRLSLCLPGPGAGAAADAFLDGLAERDFALVGHVLADIVLAERSDEEEQVRLILDALTVVES